MGRFGEGTFGGEEGGAGDGVMCGLSKLLLLLFKL